MTEQTGLPEDTLRIRSIIDTICCGMLIAGGAVGYLLTNQIDFSAFAVAVGVVGLVLLRIKPNLFDPRISPNTQRFGGGLVVLVGIIGLFVIEDPAEALKYVGLLLLLGAGAWLKGLGRRQQNPRIYLTVHSLSLITAIGAFGWIWFFK